MCTRGRPCTPLCVRRMLVIAAQAVLAVACTVPAASRPQPGPSSAVGLGPTPSPRPPAVTRVVLHSPSQSFAQLVSVVGIEEGLFLREGLEVQLQHMATSTALAGMLSGEVDYSETIGSVARAILAQQAPLRIIAVTADGIAFTLLGGAGVSTLSDLRGRAIGIYAARDTSQIGLLAIFQRHGLDARRDDITFVALGNDTGLYAGLASGAVGAAVLTPPFDVKAEQELGARRLLTLSEEVASAWTGLSTSTRKLAEQPEQVRAMLRANLQAVDFVLHQPVAVARLAAARYGVEEAVAARALEGYTRLLSCDGKGSSSAREGLVEIARQQGEISTASISPAELFDFRALDQVLSEWRPC